METAEKFPMRSVIVVTLGVCLAVAMASWFSGGQEPVSIIASAGALLLASLLLWRQPAARKLVSGPLLWSWWGLMGWAGLSLAWTANRYSTALWLTEWLMAGLVFWLAYTVAGEERGRELLIRLYLISAGIFAVVAVGMFMMQAYGRLTGMFYWANPAAAYLLPAVILSVAKVHKSHGRRGWLWVAASSGFLAAFWLTDSRAATIVLLFLLGVFCLVNKLNKAFWIKFLFAITVSVGLGFGLSWLSIITAHHGSALVPGSRFAEAASGESQSLSDRLLFLQSTAKIWWDNPVRGTGAGTYPDVHPKYQGRVVSASASAHNIYAQTVSELGIVGGLLLLSVLCWLFAGVVRGLVMNPSALAAALGAAGLLLHFGLDIDVQYPSLFMLAAMLLGLSYRQWSVARARVSWRAAAVAAVLLVPAVSLYKSQSWVDAAASYQEAGDYEGAATRLEVARGVVIYNPDLVNAEGIAWYSAAASGGKEAGKAGAKALDLAREAERLDPRDGQHFQLEGRVLSQQGHEREAETALRTALRLDPYNHPQYSLDLATIQLSRGDRDGAASTIQSMLAQYPPEVVANRSTDPTLRPVLANLHAELGNIYLEVANVSDARYQAQQALKIDTNNLRGRALLHQAELKSEGQ
jgi:O-antigen ligase/Tfp pilus assembly protein PilF